MFTKHWSEKEQQDRMKYQQLISRHVTRVNQILQEAAEAGVTPSELRIVHKGQRIQRLVADVTYVNVEFIPWNYD